MPSSQLYISKFIHLCTILCKRIVSTYSIYTSTFFVHVGQRVHFPEHSHNITSQNKKKKCLKKIRIYYYLVLVCNNNYFRKNFEPVKIRKIIGKINKKNKMFKWEKKSLYDLAKNNIIYMDSYTRVYNRQLR